MQKLWHLLLRPCHVYAADVTAANQLQLLVPCKHKAPSGFWQPAYHPALAELHPSLSKTKGICVTAEHRTLSHKVLNQLIILWVHIVVPARQPNNLCLRLLMSILRPQMQADAAVQVSALPCLVLTGVERQEHLSNSPRAYVITVIRSSAFLVFASRATCR